ncbi:putative Dynamin superfamily [Helianthus annuus]|nr:putative Dynamin superfamily [Helianthus annuus]
MAMKLHLAYELKQYPSVRAEVMNAAAESLDKTRNESKRATIQLADMECSYLTVDFFRKLPQDIEKGGIQVTQFLIDIMIRIFVESDRMCCLIVYCQVRVAKRSLHDHFFTELGAKEVSHTGTIRLISEGQFVNEVG